MTQFLGIVYSGLLGGFAFNGAGVYIGHFSPFVSFSCIGAEAGAVSMRACVLYQLWECVRVVSRGMV